MRVVRLAPHPVRCRYCGALAAKPHGNAFGMCDTCHGEFRYWVIPNEESEQTALMFLARCMRLAAVRVKRDRIFGRCECISKRQAGFAPGEIGYQCGSAARHLIDGVKVCGGHLKSVRSGQAALLRDYIATPDVSAQYDYFVLPLAELASADPDFRSAMMRAIAPTNQGD